MDLPQISHLQFAVISLISIRELNGTELKGSLEHQFGHTSSHPGFYQLMGRMEEQGLVSGKYLRVDNSEVHKRWRIYSLTPKGKAEAKKVLDFYSHMSP